MSIKKIFFSLILLCSAFLAKEELSAHWHHDHWHGGGGWHHGGYWHHDYYYGHPYYYSVHPVYGYNYYYANPYNYYYDPAYYYTDGGLYLRF